MNIINWFRGSDIIFFQYTYIDWQEKETTVDNRILIRGQETKVLSARMFDQNEFWDQYQNHDTAGFYTEGPDIHSGMNSPYYMAEREDSDGFSNPEWLKKLDRLRTIISEIIADPWKLISPITIHFWYGDDDLNAQWENVYTIFPASYS